MKTRGNPILSITTSFNSMQIQVFYLLCDISSEGIDS